MVGSGEPLTVVLVPARLLISWAMSSVTSLSLLISGTTSTGASRLVIDVVVVKDAGGGATGGQAAERLVGTAIFLPLAMKAFLLLE